MMKRNENLDEAYKSFVNDLKLLVEQSMDMWTSKIKQLNKIDKELKKKQLDPKKRTVSERFSAGEKEFVMEYIDNPSKIFKERNDLHRIQSLSNNGIFLYCVALFENYASKIVKINFNDGGRGKESPREKYIHKFKEFAKKQSKTNNNYSFVDMLTSNRKMIANYDELPDTMELWAYMLGIEKKGLFKACRFSYIELRERRNLLIHRGVYIDDRYKNSFKRANMGSDKGNEAEKFLDRIIDKYSNQSKEDKDRIDMSVSPTYLLDTFQTLLAMSSLLYMYSFQLSKKDLESEIFPESLIHDLMVFSRDIGWSNILVSIENIFIEYLENIADNDWNNIPVYDKYNLLIGRAHLLDVSKEDVSYAKKYYEPAVDTFKKRQNDRKKVLNNMRENIIPTIAEERKDEVELLESHIDGDIENLINNIKKLPIGYQQLNIWFMFKKYARNRKFQTFKKTLNNDKEQTIHKVKIHHSPR